MPRILRWATVQTCALLLTYEMAIAQVGTCFDLQTVGNWVLVDSAGPGGASRVRPDESGDSLNLTPPTRIGLAAEAVPFARDWSSIIVPENSLQVPHEFKGWRIVQDTLHIVFSTGFSGTRGVLRRSGSAWRGSIRNFSDALPFDVWEREVDLQTVDCDSAPRYPASIDRVLLRSIDLISGESIELGRPLPSGLMTERRASGALTVLDQTIGLLAGASEIVVGSNPAELVNRIELHLDVSTDLVSLVNALEVQLGPSQSTVLGGWSWRNRSTRVSVYRSSASQAVRILLTDPRYGG